MNLNEQERHIHDEMSVSQEQQQQQQQQTSEDINAPLVAAFAHEQDERMTNQDPFRVLQEDESAIKYQFSKVVSQELSSPAGGPLVDNPCWGGPQEETHNLSHLLDLIASGQFNADPTKRDETIILHNDKDFLVIDKPPDLRMDGPYPATVHKLVTYWFPPPSLTKSILEHTSDTDLTQSKHRQLLLEQISKISKTNDVPDNIIRTTHQLDYATSGVLLMAKSKEAAAIACQSFADRVTRKEYLAIVHGNIEKSVPVLTKEQEVTFSQWMDGSFEDKLRKKKMVTSIQHRKGSVTFMGYLPPHSIFAKWKGLKQKSRKRKRGDLSSDNLVAENDNTVKARSSSSSSASNLQSMTLMKPLVGIDHDEEETIVEYGWKEIKKNPKYRQIFLDLANTYNSILGKSNQQETGGITNAKEEEEEHQLPTFFRRRVESEDAFYCCSPLAEDPENFRVVVKSQALQECSMDIQSRYGLDPKRSSCDGKPLLWDFKPSLTRFVVLKRGLWNDLPVTKLLLQPRTGRRHQLRVHTAILGHPILGDCTYGMEEEVVERKSCSRMCLHAAKLSIPLRDDKMNVFMAPDPFVGLI